MARLVFPFLVNDFLTPHLVDKPLAVASFLRRNTAGHWKQVTILGMRTGKSHQVLYLAGAACVVTSQSSNATNDSNVDDKVLVVVVPSISIGLNATTYAASWFQGQGCAFSPKTRSPRGNIVPPSPLAPSPLTLSKFLLVFSPSARFLALLASLSSQTPP